MMTQLFANKVFSYLNLPLGTADTKIELVPGAGNKFPNPADGDYFLVTLESGADIEVIKCTQRYGDILTVDRAQEGTAAKYFTAGTLVEMRITAGTLADKADLTNTIDQANTSFSNTGKIPAMLSWIANRIRAITGGANWFDTPVKSLNQLSSDLDGHQAAADPHPQYATDTDLNNHVANSDPHPQYAMDTDLNNHIGNLFDAHKASSVTYAGNTNLSATNVESAIDELDNEKFPKAGGGLSGPISAPGVTSTRDMSWGANGYRTEEFNDFNAALKSGDFEATSPLSPPVGGYTDWLLHNVRDSEASQNYAMQLASPKTTDTNRNPALFLRSMQDSAASPWAKVWHSLNDGTGSGLDADLVQGKSLTTLDNTFGGTPWVSSAPPETRYRLVCKLPVSTVGTYDKVLIEIFGGAWVSSEGFFHDRIILSNRSGFKASIEKYNTQNNTYGSGNWPVIVCGQNSDGSVNVWVTSASSYYTACVVKTTSIGIAGDMTAIPLGPEVSRAETGLNNSVILFRSSDSQAYMYTFVPDATESSNPVNLRQFQSVKGYNGYQKLPSGLILVWGSVDVIVGTSGTFTFPITFPTNTFYIGGMTNQRTPDAYTLRIYDYTTSSASYGWDNFSTSGSGQPRIMKYFAVGY